MRWIHSVIVLVFAAQLGAGEALASPYPLDQILPEDVAGKLGKLGMKSSDDLVAQGATAKGRAKIVKETKIPSGKLLEWVRLCDLVRIKGVGPDVVKLLNAVKIDSVRQLKRQKAAALYKKVEKANAKVKITEKLPSEQHLADWISQAKKLKVIVR